MFSTGWGVLQVAVQSLTPCRAVGCGEVAIGPVVYCKDHEWRHLFGSRWTRHLLDPGKARCRTNEFVSGGHTFEMQSYRMGLKLHRIGGPAEVTRDDDGLLEEKWFFGGKTHRVDGPAHTVHHPSTRTKTEHFHLGGKSFHTPAAHFAEVATYPVARLREELSITPYAEFVAEGHDPYEVVRDLAAGITSAEGMRALLEGSPIEWVLAFESGRQAEA